jgi:hypothetical protein
MIVELDERSDIFAVESQRTRDLLFTIFVGYALPFWLERGVSDREHERRKGPL